MSYCRWGEDSDVYMYGTRSEGGVNGICCQGCELLPEGETSTHFDNPGDALIHLYEHRKAGHKVPYSAIKRLQVEIGNVREPLPNKMVIDYINKLYFCGKYVIIIWTARLTI